MKFVLTIEGDDAGSSPEALKSAEELAHHTANRLRQLGLAVSTVHLVSGGEATGVGFEARMKAKAEARRAADDAEAKRVAAENAEVNARSKVAKSISNAG